MFLIFKNSGNEKRALIFAISKGILPESKLIIFNGINIFGKQKSGIMIDKLLDSAKKRLEKLEAFNPDPRTDLKDAYDQIVLDCKVLVGHLNYLLILNNTVNENLILPIPINNLISLYAIDQDGCAEIQSNSSSCVIL